MTGFYIPKVNSKQTLIQADLLLKSANQTILYIKLLN